jgi:peptide/nickel transport system substrate-binding protein
VDAPDAYTAVIFLKGVAPTFLDELGRVYILDAKAYNADPANYFFKPAGTGAFTVTSFDKTTGEIHYARNDNWWGWTADNKTNVDEIIYKQIGDDTTRASALQAGDVDIATQLTIDYKKTLDPGKYTLQLIKSDAHAHIEFNAAEGKVFNDKNLREALSLSINRQQIVESILGGGATVATWPVPEGNLGFVAGQQYEYNLDKAKQLVQASGYKGEEINMIISNTGGGAVRPIEEAQAIQAMAAAVGFNIKLEPLENASFMDRRFAGGFDITLGGFAATAGDPQVEVAVIIDFDVFKSGYVNKEMHDLAFSALGEADRAKREEILKKVFQIEMTEFAPFAYLYSPIMLYATQSNITTYTVYADGSADYKFVQKH